jgi:Protein of unknown function (DUF4245)
VSPTRTGYRSSVGGLVGALIVCGALMAAVVVVTLLQSGDTDPTVPAYDYATDLQLAREQAPFDVLAPSALPSGWNVTSARWTGAGPEKEWHLGVLTDDENYVGLEQGNALSATFIEDHTKADQPGTSVEIDGLTWQTLTAGDETALVRAGDKVTTLITGTASQDELVEFATSLTAN